MVHRLAGNDGRSPPEPRRQRNPGVANDALGIADELVEGAVEVSAPVEQGVRDREHLADGSSNGTATTTSRGGPTI